VLHVLAEIKFGAFGSQCDIWWLLMIFLKIQLTKTWVLTGGATAPPTTNWNRHWATCLTCLSLYFKLFINRILLVKELKIDQYLVQLWQD